MYFAELIPHVLFKKFVKSKKVFYHLSFSQTRDLDLLTAPFPL